MSIFDAVKDVGKTLVHDVEGVAGGIAKAGAAPIGAVWDLANIPFNGKDDNFGTVVDDMAKHAKTMLDPILNAGSAFGGAFSGAMHGLDVAYREGISEPVSTFEIMGHHAIHAGDWQDVFSGQGWAQAYQAAQHRSIGQEAMVGFTNQTQDTPLWKQFLGINNGAGPDPLQQRAYRQIHENHPFLTSMGSGTVDFTARWYLDPGNLIGKGVKVYKAARVARKIVASDHAGGIMSHLSQDMERRVGVGPFKFTPRDNLHTRTNALVDFIRTGAKGSPLNGEQIFQAVPEIKASTMGRQVAGLLAHAANIKDEATSVNEIRKVLAVSYGDVNQIGQAQQELSNLGALSDALSNVAKGNVVELKAHALGDQILANPTLMAHMQGQLDNLDDAASVVQAHVDRLNSLLDVQRTMTHAAGLHPGGLRALARAEGRGLLRNGEAASGHAAFDTPVNWAVEQAQNLLKHPSVTTIYQRSSSHMPLKIITPIAHVTGKAALGYARIPMKFTDALRTSHVQGMVSVHDWNGGLNQIDAALKRGGVDPQLRLKIMSDASMARTEVDKATAVHQAEVAAKRAIIDKWTKKAGYDITEGKTLQDFTDAVFARGANKRANYLTALNGRVYAANDLAQAGEKYGMPVRVDQILPKATAHAIDDQDGVPVALPLLETQGFNYIPLVDLDRFDKQLGRDHSLFMRKAKAWQEARYEIGRLSRIKQAGTAATENLLAGWHRAVDELEQGASSMMRLWKFSVLFRLGYPLRNVIDDQSRIWAQIGAAAILHPLWNEVLKNGAHNLVGRRRAVWLADTQARQRLAEIGDLLQGTDVEAYSRASAEIENLNGRISTLSKAVTRARTKGGGVSTKLPAVNDKLSTLRARRDALQSQIGDNPEDLLREKSQLEDLLKQTGREKRKALQKRRLGEQGFDMFGQHFEGPFEGETGDSWRGAASANGMYDYIASVGEQRLFKGQSSDGGWDLVRPQQEGHLDAWAHALNNQMRQSPAAMHFIKGGDIKGFVKWVRKPEQRDLRRTLGHFAHDPEDWGNRISQMVDHYIPTKELRDILAERRVTPQELDQMYRTPSLRPEVHGATLAHNLGMSKHASVVGHALHRVFQAMSETSTDLLSRWPYFSAVYKAECRRLGEALIAERGDRAAFTAEDVKGIQDAARKNALNELKRTLFDVSAHSNAAHMLRFISPFFAAHQEAVTRWWRIMSDDPSVLRRLQQTFDIPGKLGLAVDNNGDPVKSGSAPGTGNIMLRLPKAWGFKDSNTNWHISASSLNLILQGGGVTNPGVGPIVQMPLEQLTNRMPDAKHVTALAKMLNPYLPGSLGDAALPATARRFFAATRMTPQGQADYWSLYETNLQDATMEFLQTHGDREPTQAEKAKLMRQVQHQTTLDSWFRVAQNALSPFPANPNSKFEAINQAWYKMRAQAIAQGKSQDWAMEKFKEKYGAAAMALTSSASQNIGWVDATAGSVAAIKKYSKVIGAVDPRFAGAIIGADGAYSKTNGYDPVAATWLEHQSVAPGSNETFYSTQDPKSASERASVDRGWFDYSRAMDALQAMAVDAGVQHYQDSPYLMNLKSAIVQQLSQKNHYWGEDYSNFNPTQFNNSLDDLEIIATSPALKGRSDVQVLKKFLQVRQIFTDALAQRKAEGLPSSPQAQANQPLMKQYAYIVQSMAEQNLDFQQYWYDRWLSRDPYITAVSGG